MSSEPRTPTPQRFPLALRVAWRPKAEGDSPHPKAQAGEAVNVSEGGACVHLPVHLQSGTHLELAVRTPEDTIHLSGRVVWSRGGEAPPFPHGMTVTPDTPQDRLAWELLLFEQARGVRERAARLAISVPVSCQTAGGAMDATARNVSPGGLCLLLPGLLAEGEELVLLITRASGLLEVNGRVAWTDAEPDTGGLIAHGIAFATAGAGAAAMEALIEAHRRAALPG